VDSSEVWERGIVFMMFSMVPIIIRTWVPREPAWHFIMPGTDSKEQYTALKTIISEANLLKM
jgi:hypothetical protein